MKDINTIQINKDQIQNLKEVFSDGFCEFIISFFNEFEVKSNELLFTIEEKEFKRAAQMAHALRGSSLNVGAQTLADACHDVEVACQAQNEQNALQAFRGLGSIQLSTKDQYYKFIN